MTGIICSCVNLSCTCSQCIYSFNPFLPYKGFLSSGKFGVKPNRWVSLFIQTFFNHHMNREPDWLLFRKIKGWVIFIKCLFRSFLRDTIKHSERAVIAPSSLAHLGFLFSSFLCLASIDILKASILYLSGPGLHFRLVYTFPSCWMNHSRLS